MPHTLFQLLGSTAAIRSEKDTAAPTELDRAKWLLLEDLQNNILSGHHRENAVYLFLRFRPDGAAQARFLLGMLACSPAERRELFAKPGLAGAAAGGWPLLVSAQQARELQEMQVLSERAMFAAARASASGAVDEGGQKAAQAEGGQKAAQAERGQKAAQAGGRQKAAQAEGGMGEGGEGDQDAAAPEYVLSLMLSRSGYEKLDEKAPDDTAFRAGMRERGTQVLGDHWSEEAARRYGEIDALVVVAFDDGASSERLNAFREVVSAHVDIAHEDAGRVLRNRIEGPNGKGAAIEPFGFVDGVSQPRFHDSGPGSLPMALEVVLVPDPNGRTPYASGTYFVFRKLEQDIEAFYAQATKLAESSGRKLELEGVLAELVGRARDGTPLVPHESASSFDFTSDPRGLRCPFHAHVRRVNPRSDVGIHERRFLVRRGIPYGPALLRDERGTPQLTPDGGRVQPVDAGAPGPAQGVGLLFCSAQANIVDQFEHIQRIWANHVQFPWGKTGSADALIGQLPAGQTNRIASIRKDPASDAPYSKGLDTEWAPVIEFMGGEYFFAPSIGFLRGLLDDLLALASETSASRTGT